MGGKHTQLRIPSNNTQQPAHLDILRIRRRTLTPQQPDFDLITVRRLGDRIRPPVSAWGGRPYRRESHRVRDTVVVDIDRVSGVQPRCSICTVLPGSTLGADILLQIGDEVCRRGEERVVLQVSGGGEALRENRGPDERFLPLSVSLFHETCSEKRGGAGRKETDKPQYSNNPLRFQTPF